MTRLGPAPTTTRAIERRPAAPVDPVALAVAVATAYVEVRAGRRPPDQLRPLLSPRARRHLRALLLRRRGQQHPSCGGASVSRLVTAWPHANALEVVVVLRDVAGVTVVAVRADRRSGRWWITDVGAPEDRQPLVPPGAPQPAPRTRREPGPVRLRDTS